MNNIKEFKVVLGPGNNDSHLILDSIFDIIRSFKSLIKLDLTICKENFRSWGMLDFNHTLSKFSFMFE